MDYSLVLAGLSIGLMVGLTGMGRRTLVAVARSIRTALLTKKIVATNVLLGGARLWLV